MACVIVLGCYRSGTSAVSGILHHLGVMMGKEFDQPAKSNPKGYFEDVEFKKLYSKLAEGKEVEGSIKLLVKMRELEYPLWGVKDPQLCLLLHKFVSLISSGHKLISTNRSAEAICNSLAKAMPDLLPKEPKSFMPLVDYYLARKDANLEIYKGEVLNIEFEKIQYDPKETVGKIAEFVGVPVTQAAIDHVVSNTSS